MNSYEMYLVCMNWTCNENLREPILPLNSNLRVFDLAFDLFCWHVDGVPVLTIRWLMRDDFIEFRYKDNAISTFIWLDELCRVWAQETMPVVFIPTRLWKVWNLWSLRKLLFLIANPVVQGNIIVQGDVTCPRLTNFRPKSSFYC